MKATEIKIGRIYEIKAGRNAMNLAKSNVAPKTAQTLARHSDINLTMKIYTHVMPEEQAAA